MSSRTRRLLAIRNIISQQQITNQVELMEQLVKQGFQLTQATLSRDLKYLKAGKIPDERKGYIYRIPENNVEESKQTVAEDFPLNGFQSVEFAHHLGVMKVLPGYAPGIASAIDNRNHWEILGTIAGDDTILIIPREGISNEEVREVIGKIMDLS